MSTPKTIYLIGNPNIGKSSLFNSLTGLKQKTSNFPGVTVEKKRGQTNWNNQQAYDVFDLPGIYSLYPRKEDEQVCYSEMLSIATDNKKKKNSVIVCCVNATNLRRNLFLFTQLKDWNLPIIICLTMVDMANKKGIQIDENELSRKVGCQVLKINPNKKKTLKPLFQAIQRVFSKPLSSNVASPPTQTFYDKKIFSSLNHSYSAKISYLDFHLNISNKTISQFSKQIQDRVIGKEVLSRYNIIDKILQHTVTDNKLNRELTTKKLDSFLLHPLWGYFTLIFVLFIFFQLIFALAEYPMSWIDSFFSFTINKILEYYPENIFSNFLANGLLSGLNAVLVFVPQIMILFGLINILEDSGYMARISYLTDKIMKKFGLSGKSVIPLISGMACAIPAIMATRSIESKKEKLLSIFVTPLISCSARLPVYILLITLVVPSHYLWGFVGMQGLVLFGLYILSFVSALVVSFILNKFIQEKEKNIFFLELPNYIPPRWYNVGISMIQKGKIFIFDAGKMILLMSIIIWALSSFGPPSTMKNIEQKHQQPNIAKVNKSMIKKEKLENSFAGIMGKSIEPAIEPLGFDWRIGITLITSFAAREVFVSTVSILFHEGNTDEGILQRLRKVKKSNGQPMFDLATSFSLIIFFAFALQCMSTLAIVKRELGSWKYPIIQFMVFFILAYCSSFFTYWILS